MTRYPTSTSIASAPRGTSPCFARRRASQIPTAYPMTYITPYQRSAMGPIRKISGGILGNGIVRIIECTSDKVQGTASEARSAYSLAVASLSGVEGHAVAFLQTRRPTTLTDVSTVEIGRAHV